MIDLEKIRKNINKVDEEMAELFCERMALVKDVALYKKEHGLNIFDEKRENFLIEKNSSYVKDEILKSYYINFLKKTMEVSKQYQKRIIDGIKVSVSGVEGAFAHIAGKKIFPMGEFCFYDNFESTYKSVENGETDVCVLPIENSYAGEVSQVIDLIFNGNLYVNGVYDLEICHNLLGTNDATINDIKTVVSHPQALNQCEHYIRKHNFKTINETNTAISAEFVANKNDKTIGAVASRETAKLYGLKVLDHHINESTLNTTRFAVLSRVENRADKSDSKFIMMFAVNNEAGALAKVINIIGKYGFNMQVLRSKPIKEEPWKYYFYVEAQGNAYGENAKNMLKELSKQCEKLKIAGSFQSEENL